MDAPTALWAERQKRRLYDELKAYLDGQPMVRALNDVSLGEWFALVALYRGVPVEWVMRIWCVVGEPVGNVHVQLVPPIEMVHVTAKIS